MRQSRLCVLTGAAKLDHVLSTFSLTESRSQPNHCRMINPASSSMYAIPVSVTRGKNKITIRSHGQPGNMAGGFYGVRIIRNE